MIEIVMPKSGITMDEGTIIEWVVKVGDSVEKGDTIASIETDKSVLEIEAPASGIMKEIFVEEEETVSVGTIIATMSE
jgi:pyruvate dehydrogenase E2 component (dihydrolipoamide acetyltransferase)